MTKKQTSCEIASPQRPHILHRRLMIKPQHYTLQRKTQKETRVPRHTNKTQNYDEKCHPKLLNIYISSQNEPETNMTFRKTQEKAQSVTYDYKSASGCKELIEICISNPTAARRRKRKRLLFFYFFFNSCRSLQLQQKEREKRQFWWGLTQNAPIWVNFNGLSWKKGRRSASQGFIMSQYM